MKIDYFYDESQQVVRFYEDALKEAAKYQLMVDFHGADKPTGLNRTFPNELTREGIRGLEIRGPWATTIRFCVYPLSGRTGRLYPGDLQSEAVE